MKIHNMEQGTPEWFAVRLGRPSASCFSNLVTSTGAPSKSMPAYAQELAGQLYAGRYLDDWQGNIYTDRGHELEHEARLAYEMMTSREVEQVGFITDDLDQYGCSPDGMTEDGLIEIKCLPKKHIHSLLYYRKHGKAPPDYIQQVQGQMFITGRQWCDLVFYQPDLPTLIVRIEPDEKIVTGLKSQLMACIEERDKVLKELNTF